MGLDINAPFGEDVALGPQPDVSVVGVPARTNDFDFIVERDELIQRLIRRLLTAPGEWIPFPDYGAGLRRFVGEPLSARAALEIRQICAAQILMEDDVVDVPAPVVVVNAVPNGIYVSIKVFTKAAQLVSFAFNPANVG